MKVEEARSVADVLAAQERAKLAPLAQAGARTRRFMDRLRVGAFTLLAAFFVQQLAQGYFPGLVPMALGFAAGLLVAVTYPTRGA